jgi:hypothetical protein
MEEMPSLNMPVQRLRLAILSLDLPCSGTVTHSEDVLTTGKSNGKKLERFSLNDDTDMKNLEFITVNAKTFYSRRKLTQKIYIINVR